MLSHHPRLRCAASRLRVYGASQRSQRSLDEVKRNRGFAQAMNATFMPPPSLFGND